MEIIHHRVNSSSELKRLDTRYGAEIDIRSSNGGLLIHHDALSGGESLERWLSSFNHGTLILNLKESGLEHLVLSAMEDHEISNFFFLDQDFPTTFRLAQSGERRCALRVSDLEPIEVASHFAGKVDWVWLDTFLSFTFSNEEVYGLKNLGFKVCLVSPELHRNVSDDKIESFLVRVHEQGIVPDAVCTKRPEIWENGI